MYKCFRCGAEFDEPERIVLGINQGEVLTVCPKCGDNDITVLKNKMGKEKKEKE